jgi:hypothetical protein
MPRLGIGLLPVVLGSRSMGGANMTPRQPRALSGGRLTRRASQRGMPGTGVVCPRIVPTDIDVNDFRCKGGVNPAKGMDRALSLWLGTQLFEDRDGSRRLGPVAIVDADVGAPNDAVLIDDIRRRQREGPGVIPVVHGEVDAKLLVQHDQVRGKPMHQPVLPGDFVTPIDQDRERARREAGLVKDGIKGMPWGQRPDLTAHLWSHHDQRGPQRLDLCHRVLESSLLHVAVRSPHPPIEHQH